MKRIFTRILGLSVLLLSMGTGSLHAQMIHSPEIIKAPGTYMVKVNLLGLPLNSYSLQFERGIGNKTAFGLGIKFRPKGGIPMASGVESLIDDPEAWNDIKDFKTGNFAISPEVRFYMGKGLFRGFYVAPFARYSKHSAELPLSFEVPNETGNTTTEIIPLNGNLTALTGGVLLGAQWKVSNLVYIDWGILGPQYGFSSGKIIGNRPLSAEEQDVVREELKSLEDLPLINTAYTVDSNGATVDFKGPWAGVRSSFSIGFRF